VDCSFNGRERVQAGNEAADQAGVQAGNALPQIRPSERARASLVEHEIQRELAGDPVCHCCGREVTAREAVGRPVCARCSRSFRS